jgi:glycerol uptake facilitator-like aquaporin
VPQPGFSCAQAFGAEALFTGLLVSTVLHMGASTGYQGNQLNGLALSLSLGVGLMASGMISGGGLNPAAVMGLFLSNGGSRKQLQEMWVYLVGPMVGAVLAHASVKLTSPIDMGKE